MSSHATTHTEEAEHGTIKSFAVVWIILLVFTGIEVLLAYEQITPVIMLTALIGLSVIKAALIIAYFMHLKFERFSLFLTLFPMLIFCILMMFVFMPDSMRAMLMRVQCSAVWLSYRSPYPPPTRSASCAFGQPPRRTWNEPGFSITELSS